MSNPVFDLSAVLRAAQMSHQQAHWTTKGPTFYADHQLFGLLYEAIEDEFDTLDEKAVHQFGPECVDSIRQVKSMLECLQEWDKKKDLVERAYAVETAVQWEIRICREALVKKKELQPGMDNFLAQLADNHDKALYLLGQRKTK